LAKGKKKGADPTASANGAAGPQKMTRKEFERELYKLQVELMRLQAWVVAEGARVIVVFEGRDTAGKGGVISRIIQRCSPRVFKHIALPTSSDREKSQLYIQRYIAFSSRGRDRLLRLRGGRVAIAPCARPRGRHQTRGLPAA
jgi:polyphosphate kinase